MTDLTLRNGDLRLAASVEGKLDGPPILFLHGFTMSRDTWAEAGRALGAKHAIWTLDFRGHGHSERAQAYRLSDYVSDARAALDAIGRSAIVVGHSLGAVVAGTLAQSRDATVRGVFLEDPPWFLGDPAQWSRSAFPSLFAFVRHAQARWQADRAPLSEYLSAMSNAPMPAGGTAKDHFSARHLLSAASALQRHDVATWSALLGEDGQPPLLDAFEPERPMRCPAVLLHGDGAAGGAVLDGHAARFSKAHPRAQLLHYAGCGHHLHRELAFEKRFAEDLARFVKQVLA